MDVGVRDDEGLSPSMWACRLDHIEHFALLSTVQTQQLRGRNHPDDDDEEDGFERDKARRTWMHWSIRRTEPLECLKVRKRSYIEAYMKQSSRLIALPEVLLIN